MSINSIEAVLPVRLSGEKEHLTGERFVMLLESLSANWIDPRPLKLTVVGLGDELPQLRRLAGSRSSLQLILLDEREIIGDPRIQALWGWHKQMFIKLLFARICDADAYLYLDADTLCVRPLSASHMISGGRALSDWYPKANDAGWWAASRALLDRASSPHARGISVTPNVLTREIARAVPVAVAVVCGGNPFDAMVARSTDYLNCWVENAIYTELGEMTGDLARLHAPEDGLYRYHSDADLWVAEQIEHWRPIEALEASPATRFMVVQSLLSLRPEFLRERLGPILQPR